MKGMLIGAAIAVLAGCTSNYDPEEHKAWILAKHQDTCHTYGFTPGTDAFANCVQREYERVAADHRAAKQRDIDTIGILTQ